MESCLIFVMIKKYPTTETDYKHRLQTQIILLIILLVTLIEITNISFF